MRCVDRGLLVCLVFQLPCLAIAQSDVADLAGADVESGTLTFRMSDGQGASIPGRLLFLGDGGPKADLFPNTQARPQDLAVRFNIVYSLSGSGTITVPVGEYTVYASRGIEWSIAQRDVSITAESATEWDITLQHEVDTSGWISGDYHLHTLTYSGHGDSNLNERIISLAGEGVEFAVATDHNHNTDYEPTINDLGATSLMSSVTGNEVSTPIGHFNAFPVDPDRAPVESRMHDAGELFTLIRDEPNAFDIEPIIQLNHPRWGGIDYFGQLDFDPVTATSSRPQYSDAFDSLEVMNENVGWGFYDAEVDEINASAGRHSVLQDWFNLLNRGHRAAGIGNSDSHTVHYALAGYPRNYTKSTTDDAGSIDAAEVAGAIRQKSLFFTTGPFVEMTINGAGLGEQVVAADGQVKIEFALQAASWIDVDRAQLVVNGKRLPAFDLPPLESKTRMRAVRTLTLPYDAWIVLIVEGDTSLAPIVGDQGRPVLPIAVTNPIWIDVDGDGRWTSPLDRGESRVLAGDESWDETSIASSTERVSSLLGAMSQRNEVAVSLATRGLADSDRRVQLVAARLAQRLAHPSLVPAIEASLDLEPDRYLRTSLLLALHATDEDASKMRFRQLVASDEGMAIARRYADELTPLIPGEPVTRWMAVGYFPNPSQSTLVSTTYEPESAFDPRQTFEGKDETTLRWRRMNARPDGYLDLRLLDARRDAYENAISYVQCWVKSESDRSVMFAMGADDGSRLFVNDELIYEDNTRHGASPMQVLDRMDLVEGWNRVLIKVENGGGDTGLYFRILDDDVETSVTPH